MMYLSRQCWGHAEDAEPYLLGHLTPEQNKAARVHLVSCSRCTRLVEEAAQFIAIIRSELMAHSASEWPTSTHSGFLERRRKLKSMLDAHRLQ